jgi:hypothetical protein
MPFDWREFLVLAHELRRDSRESVQRTCLGRTYYYVYNLGLTKARTLNFNDMPPSLHRELWTWCQKHRDPIIQRLGIDGSRMHALRIDADYKDARIRNLAGEVEKQLGRAQAFECSVAQSSGQPPPASLSP